MLYFQVFLFIKKTIFPIFEISALFAQKILLFISDRTIVLDALQLPTNMPM